MCKRSFKTPQGKGGHLLHAPDVAHKLYRQQDRLLAAQATRPQPVPVAPAPASTPPPSPAHAAPPPPPAPYSASPAPVTLALTPLARSSLRSLGPDFGWGSPPAPAPVAQALQTPMAPIPAPPRAIKVADFAKPGGAILAGGAVGLTLAGQANRGVGFLFGAGMGLLVWWAIENRRNAPPAAKQEARAPVVDVPKQWQGVLVPGAGWAL